MRIVVIDDDRDVVRLLDIKLSREGHEVWTATDGRAGAEAIRERRPDVVVLETEVSGKHGHDIVREAKQGGGSQPLVIVLSHQSTDEAIEAALDAGADDYLVKPFSPRVLSERIRVNAIRNR